MGAIIILLDDGHAIVFDGRRRCRGGPGAPLAGSRRRRPPQRSARRVEPCPTKPIPRDFPATCRPMSAFRTASPASRSTTSTTTRGAPSWRWPGRRRRDARRARVDQGDRDAGPRVFETYKPLWEIFHADGSAPDAVVQHATTRPPPTRAAPRRQFGDVTIGSASGIDDIGQAGIGVLDPPIVAQNGRYVRTLTLFNQIAFDHIVRNRFFLRERAAAGARARGPTVPSSTSRRYRSRSKPRGST